MLTPGYANRWFHFYPVGNTPAVCLTQGLPPGLKADMLLLGCGDVRNILFTAQCDASRDMDITCCDVEPAILARNILLITLLLNTRSSTPEFNKTLWSIYYNPLLPGPATTQSQTLTLIQTQAQTLLSHSTSLTTWNSPSNPYSPLIQFTTQATIASVAAVWKFYASASTTNNEETQTELKSLFRKAGAHGREVGAESTSVLGVVRASTPAAVEGEAVRYGGKLGRLFWECGHLDLESGVDLGSLESNKANPMFGSPDETVRVHYGLGPLEGFHLGCAYLPVVSMEGSSSGTGEGQGEGKGDRLEKLVNTAKREFGMWCDAFRAVVAAGRIKLRFFAGDAFLFAHTLQHRAMTGSSRSAGWYRMRHGGFKPLVLEEEQYGREGDAPVQFNVIDTSNLVDHLGAWNLLAAVSPLLSEESAGATLYTESQTRPPNSAEHLEDVLGSDPSTVSLLLGLVPAEYVTNTSPWPVGDEQALELRISGGNANDPNEQTKNQAPMHTRISWKRPFSQSGRPGLEPLHIDPEELAVVLCRVYNQLYPAENVLALLANMSLSKAQGASLPTYTRAGFAAVLKIIRGRVATDWDHAMGLFLELVERKGSMMNTHYLQELYLYMHLLKVHSVETFSDFAGFRAEVMATSRGDNDNETWKRFLAWQNMPSSMVLTLKVPRSALSALTQPDAKAIGTIPVHGVVRAPLDQFLHGWENFFPAVQLAFGTLSTSGTPFSNSFRVSIREDPTGWQGTSPLLVSFRVPSWSLFIDPDNPPLAGFAIQSTPVTSSPTLIRQLGLELSVFRVAVTDFDAVCITPDLPNQTGNVVIPGFAPRSLVSSSPSTTDPRFKLTITAHAGPQLRLSGLSARLDILTPALKAALLSGSAISVTVTDPSHVAVIIGIAAPMEVRFPFAVDEGIRVRVARSSSYVELVAGVVSDPWERPHKAFTALLIAPVAGNGSQNPVCWTLPYVTFSSATPALSLGPYTNPHDNPLTFLTPHLARLFTAHELQLLDNPLKLRPLIGSPPQNARLSFKETLQALFLHAAGLVSPPAHTQTPTKPKINTKGTHFSKSRSRLYILRPSSSLPSPTSSPESSPDSSSAERSYLRSQLQAMIARNLGMVTLCCVGDILLFLSRLHLDTARRTVLWDAAVVVVSPGVMAAVRDAVKNGDVEDDTEKTEFVVEAEEEGIWRGVLPAWAERSRIGWEHGGDCAYNEAGSSGTWQAPVSWEGNKEVFCDCGKGSFPPDWAHSDLPLSLWEILKPHAVRVAIAPVFASALAGPLGVKREEVKVTSGGAGDGERQCRGCGSWVAKEGGTLKACGKCGGVKYCGRACQRGDWKRHKGGCKK
ncbi:uncharacterized protein C8A04DRAFT_30601 [Dichotomopilus funicola]|uniref:MYND-type domain-containing protein n=1 Tax=Dichotomopilus funicola TaxID=1934379 RepID=A0AAN6ZKF7_9PEZI|nr:hypothetical protein C8A04DRAFT_30601 [Dichotomopilus funicola]